MKDLAMFIGMLAAIPVIISIPWFKQLNHLPKDSDFRGIIRRDILMCWGLAGIGLVLAFIVYKF